MATRTNLSELALRNSTLTVFFMLVLTIGGLFAYFSLGRAEDPPFTIKQMVVSAAWPGATSRNPIPKCGSASSSAMSTVTLDWVSASTGTITGGCGARTRSMMVSV